MGLIELAHQRIAHVQDVDLRHLPATLREVGFVPTPLDVYRSDLESERLTRAHAELLTPRASLDWGIKDRMTDSW